MDTYENTFSLLLLVSAGLGIGFVPEWTQDLPNRGFELKLGAISKSGWVFAWNRGATATPDDIIDARFAAGHVREVVAGRLRG
ncbi:hypothetical protein ACCS42_09210 [Rhizobium ruizarguesonis]